MLTTRVFHGVARITLVRYHVIPSNQVVKKMRDKRPCLVAFSCGKDSIVTMLCLMAAGYDVRPYFAYLVPDLEFVERSLAYYEEFFKLPILRIPHASLHRMVRRQLFQSPDRWHGIKDAHLGKFAMSDMQQLAATRLRLPEGTWCAMGVRACDSLGRRIALIRQGSIVERSRTFYPVWDWTAFAVRKCLVEAKVKLPPDYWMFGRSFDGVGPEFLFTIRREYPDDYARIVKVFPMAEGALLRYDRSRA